MRALAHRMVDDMFTYLETVRERPAWQPLPAEVRARLAEGVPAAPQGAQQAYRDFLENVLPYPSGNIHPRFWGWARGSGTVLGMLAEMLAAGMNPHAGGGQHAAVYVERQVLDWCKALLGYPAEAGGILLSGTSMANLIGLAVARNTLTGDVRRRGVHALPRPLTVYGSREMHSSVQKAVELLGLGSDALRYIPVDAAYRVDVAALARAIAADRAAGYQPLAIVGCAGTVNTGAFDDLEALAELSRREGLWFHVDGAFGAMAALVPELRELTRGMERADSLAFDLHKWLYMPIEAGCVLVRDAGAHRRAFALTPEYLAHSGERGFAVDLTYFADRGLQLTRGFRALKIWLALKADGADRYARLVAQNVAQARYLAARVDATPGLERIAPVPLNIVCFRYAAPGLNAGALDALNREIILQLQESGTAVVSSTTLDGKYAMRVAITNHRSRREDFDVLVEEIVRLGERLVREL